ncbi:dihydroorotate oxidase [Leptolyngbya sp. BL0902]|uniref:hypothetical protein n=1 Tax=Leptolyngbya sp. BL0902 TaxID=1115757 RepID=UPI0018E87B60|nr:hypothetical protein [Leptolyngbya sp. BL0902]QQE64872.1 dihydroorotate oxidase [Leptolyngbya sp. BL0902]
MQTYGNTDVTHNCWTRSTRVASFSGLLLGKQGGIRLLSLATMPYGADTVALPLNAHGSQGWLPHSSFILAFLILPRHLWHALQSTGFDFRRVEQALSAIES